MFNRGRYKFLMIDPSNNSPLLSERFFLKINALNCFYWHSRLNHRLKYRLIDTKTGSEVQPTITYKLLKGPNV